MLIGTSDTNLHPTLLPGAGIGKSDYSSCKKTNNLCNCMILNCGRKLKQSWLQTLTLGGDFIFKVGAPNVGMVGGGSPPIASP